MQIVNDNPDILTQKRATFRYLEKDIAFQLVKDNALTAKQKLGHTSHVHVVLTSGELFSLVRKARVSENLQGLYWRNANR